MTLNKFKTMKKIQILFIFVIVVIGACYLVYREGSLPVDKTEKTPKNFKVKTGESLNTIANNLSNEGFIRSKLVFYLIVKRLGIEKNIQAGEFQLSTSMDAETIAKSLTHGTVDTWVTIIEGLRKEEIAEVVSQKFGVSETEFANLAEEGYLFPDTYSIPNGADSEKILSILKDNFNKKYKEISADAKKRNLSEKDVVTLASLVEREARTDEDKQEVASILLKRLKEGWTLDIDATVQYALGYQANEKRWWKKEPTLDDLKIDSPYNTYKVSGLPAGPICSPGFVSLSAVAHADATTPYWFYVSDTEGKLHFGKTLEEHNANIKKYL